MDEEVLRINVSMGSSRISGFYPFIEDMYTPGSVAFCGFFGTHGLQ